ncbi:MAG: FAD-dependent oxidoreductase [Thiohalomonadaceae bacterium]
MYSKKYPKLFSKGKIGNVEIRNRIVMTPMGTGHCGPDSRVTQELIDFYAARAKGGVGMIITETNYQSEVDATPFTFGMARLDHPNKIARQAELVDMVKYYGAVLCIQLSIGMGRQSDAPWMVQPVAPSECPATNDPNVICRELTKEEIKKMVSNIATSAEYAVTCGYPIAEIHGHAGYLIDQFMSPDSNTRTDEYGGDLEGRLRIVKEIREEIKKRVGDALAVSFRISADQKVPGFRTLEEGVEICKLLESFGYDALNIDAGRYESIDWIFPTEYLGVACMADLANAVKANVSVPVIAVGNYNYPDVAEQSLNNNDADFIALGRSLLADPEWANKARFGREEEIRSCIRCNEKCIMNVLIGKELTCTVNPQCGREARFRLSKTDKPRRVTVIGGGPAGMEAAVIAAERGHKVTLLEQREELGGQLNYADLEPFKWSISDFNRYLKKQVVLKGVDIKFNTKADVDVIKATRPDAVVVATGADVYVPKAFANAGVLTVADLPSASFKDKENIVVIGGGLVGCEAALGLAMKGHKVTLLEMRDDVAMDLNMINKFSLMNELNKYKVNIVTGVTCSETSGSKLIGTDKDGKTAEFSFDKVVTATGTRKINEIADAVEKAFPDTYVIGDCVNIGKIADAVHKGFIVGTQI